LKSLTKTFNGPDALALEPGEHAVFDVSLDPAVWENSPLPNQGEIKHIKMSATYGIGPSPDAQKMDVWQGAVSSKELSFQLSR